MEKYICTSCGQPKEAKEFNKDKANTKRGGCRYICRDCEKKIRKKANKIVGEVVSELQTATSYKYDIDGHKFIANDVGKQGITIQVLMRGVDPDELSGIHVPQSLLPVFISVKFRKWLGSIVCQLEARG